MWWLYLFGLPFAEDEHSDQHDINTKIVCCVKAVHAKMAEDQLLIYQSLEAVEIDNDKVLDKIAADLLLNCYTNVEISTAEDALLSEVFQLNEALRAVLTYEPLLGLTDEEYEFSAAQRELIDQIDRAFENKPVTNMFWTWAPVVVLGSMFGLLLKGVKAYLDNRRTANSKAEAKKIG